MKATSNDPLLNIVCPAWFDFCLTPIPADFFGLGSAPFDGEVQLQGATGGTDTIVQRLNTMAFGADAPIQTTPIELVQLDLVSCEPITVQVGGRETRWDVAVSLSERPAPLGMMVVTRTHENGGVFSSDFSVQPVFTFTRVADPTDVRVLDTGEFGIPPSQFNSLGNAPWSHEVLVQPTADGQNRYG